MPLVIFTGFPSSGKTTWAKKLQTLLEQKIESLAPNEPGSNYKVIYHSDETLGINHEDYRESRTEKSIRGNQMSAVKRDISRTNIVILDSLAYIKGFRYQLYCEAKGLSTSHCIIQVLTPLEKCLEWNESRTEGKWDSELLQAIHMRYEEPNGNNRWDSPLFPVAYDETSLPLEEMWDALVLKKAAPPNAATLLKPASSTNFLQELDKCTMEVISKIIAHQQLQAVGGDVLIQKGEMRKNDVMVEMPSRPISIAQLQRIRRTYIGLNRMRTVDTDRISPLFADYLNRSLNNEE